MDENTGVSISMEIDPRSRLDATIDTGLPVPDENTVFRKVAGQGRGLVRYYGERNMVAVNCAGLLVDQMSAILAIENKRERNVMVRNATDKDKLGAGTWYVLFPDPAKAKKPKRAKRPKAKKGE